ncbi:hypothetical protein J6590_085246 [Homalodisca vitripennis]|nr:hypothetical protein J6590_085246 [Homalodisca vitripennis]
MKKKKRKRKDKEARKREIRIPMILIAQGRLDTSKSVEKRIKWPKPEEKKEEDKARRLANKSQTCVRGGGGNEGLRPQHVPLSLSLNNRLRDKPTSLIVQYSKGYILLFVTSCAIPVYGRLSPGVKFDPTKAVV